MLAWIANLDFAAGDGAVDIVEGSELFLTYPWIWHSWRVT